MISLTPCISSLVSCPSWRNGWHVIFSLFLVKTLLLKSYQVWLKQWTATNLAWCHDKLVQSSINREKVICYQLEFGKYLCRRFDWMLQSSSGWKWKKCEPTLLFIAMHYWGYTSDNISLYLRSSQLRSRWKFMKQQCSCLLRLAPWWWFHSLPYVSICRQYQWVLQG